MHEWARVFPKALLIQLATANSVLDKSKKGEYTLPEGAEENFS